ncbi:MAG TPA: hypothetical protein VIV15_03685 [Anaerolineales bacterium]
MRSKITAMILTAALFLAACGPSKPSPELQIRLAVTGTLSAIPTPTRGALLTPFPSPTAFSLVGLFCEYQFCIGHPQDMAFFDVSAQRNPGAPSTYAQGILAAYNANLFIQLLWQTAPGATDPNFMLDLILDKDFDTASGQVTPNKLRDMNTVFEPIQSTASPVLPYGAAGAWTCGDRSFAWKVYTPDTGSGQGLFQNAINRFSCRK